MLKAVRFDEQEHKHLLKFFSDYRNDKGRENESEAMRHLMQVGWDYLHSPPPVPVIIEKPLIVEKIVEQKVTEPAPEIDLNKLKLEILNDLMTSLPEQQDISNIKKEIIKDFNKKIKNNSLDIDSIKRELLLELKLELKKDTPVQQSAPVQDSSMAIITKLIENMNNNSSPNQNDILFKILERLEKIESQPQIIKQTTQRQEENYIKETPAAKDKIEIPADADGLLANILNNANR